MTTTKSTVTTATPVHFLADKLHMIDPGVGFWERLLTAAGSVAKTIGTAGTKHPWPFWWGDVQEISFASWDGETLVLVGTCKVLVSPLRQSSHMFFAVTKRLSFMGTMVCTVGDDFDDLSQHFPKEVEEAMCLAGLLGSPQMGVVPVVLEQF